jgi:hypothetical protein
MVVPRPANWDFLISPRSDVAKFNEAIDLAAVLDVSEEDAKKESKTLMVFFVFLVSNSCDAHREIRPLPLILGRHEGGSCPIFATGCAS